MDFFADDGGTGLGFDDADDVIANEEFSSWLNTQVPRPPQGPTNQGSMQPQLSTQPSPQLGMQQADFSAQIQSGASPPPSAYSAMNQARKQSPAPQISPKTQSGTPNAYNAWKSTDNSVGNGAGRRQSPMNGGPGFEGTMHGRTPSVAAGMSRYTAQMPSQRMMPQHTPQQGPPNSLGTPHGLQTPQNIHAPNNPNVSSSVGGPELGAAGPRDAAAGPGGPVGAAGLNGPVGPGGPGGALNANGPGGPGGPGGPVGPQMSMPQGMASMEGPMGHMPPMPQGLQNRMASGMMQMPMQGMASGPQRGSMMGPALSQGVVVPPGNPSDAQGIHGIQAAGPQGMSGVGGGPMGNIPQGQPQMFPSQPMHGQMMNPGMQETGTMGFTQGIHGNTQGSQSMGDGTMSPQMGSHMSPSMLGSATQGRAASAASSAPARRVKKRTASTASNPGGTGMTHGGPAGGGAQSPVPTPTPAPYAPSTMGPSMPPQGAPHRPMSRPGSSIGLQQSPGQQAVTPGPFSASQMPLSRVSQQPSSDPMLTGGGNPSVGQPMARGPTQMHMPTQDGHSLQGQAPTGRSGSNAALNAYSMPNDVVRLSLIALSLYTQVLKYGAQSIVMKEILRRIDSFPPLEQRRMVEKFELSRGGMISELSRLPIGRLLPPVFWRTLSECYNQTGTPPIPQSVSLGANSPHIPLFPLFQAVQSVGGYLDATFSGRWPVVLRMLSLSTQTPLTAVELIWVYATTVLSFEVYATQNEGLRRQLISQLAPPRQSTSAQPGPVSISGTPQRPESINSPNSSTGAGPGSVGPDMRNAQRAPAAQRLRGAPTQQAPAAAQTQVRAPQRRAPPGMTQPGMIPATQAMQRNAIMGQRPPSQMGGLSSDSVGTSSNAATVGPTELQPAAPSAQSHMMQGGVPQHSSGSSNMAKPLVNGGMTGMPRGGFMGSNGPGGPGAMQSRRAAASRPAQGSIPQNGSETGNMSSAALQRHPSVQGGFSQHPGGASDASLSSGMSAGQMPTRTMPGVSQNAEAAPNTGSKRMPSSLDDEGRKRSRLGSARHSEQLRRDAHGKSIFSALLEDGQYLLQRRHSSTHGGRNVRFLSALGNEIENWRPEVAFPLDLGIVDLHAVTRSLASRHPAEVRQTLDKLIVVSANPRVHESLQHCPRLLANLCKLATTIIDQLLLPADERKILHPAVSSSEAEIVDDDSKLLARGSKGLRAMNKMLEKYKHEAKSEIVIEVDSQTGSETGRRFVRGADGQNDTALEPDHLMEPLEPPSATPEIFTPEEASTAEKEDNTEADEPFCYPSYGTRYQRVESEICALEKPSDEMSEFLTSSLCDRLLLATCVLRNLSFSETNRPVIARKPEFLQLLWRVLEVLGTHKRLLDTELRTMDLCKDLLTVLGNVALYVQLDNPRDTLKLMLFLLSFAPVESPYTDEGDLKLMDYDIDVHRYLPNAIDVFAKIAPRENPNRHLVEEVLLGTSEDPGYKVLLRRWLMAQGRTELYPAELLSRMFALSIAMMPFTHFRPPSRDIDTRQPYLLQASMAAELMVNMIPDSEEDDNSGVNIALSWLESVEHFGARMVRTLNFMGMVVVNQPELSGENMRPFAKITQRGVNVVQRLFKKAKRSPEFKGSGIAPTIEHLLGGLMAAKMDKVVVKHLNALYNESTSLQEADDRRWNDPSASTTVS